MIAASSSTRSSTVAVAITLSALLGVVPACMELDTIGQPVTITSYRFVGSDDAAMRLRNARVSRDVTCDAVGPGHRYHDLHAALVERGKASKAYLERCQTGVADVPLEACLAEVKAAPCGVLLDGVDGLGACRLGDICLPR